jgi:hypothetical protein
LARNARQLSKVAPMRVSRKKAAVFDSKD